MKIVVAPDSFKECLDAFAVAEAVAAGLRRGASQPVDVYCYPLADGGEGLLDVLHHALGGDIQNCTATGAVGEKIQSAYGLFEEGRTAVIEMARVAGLHLVPPSERDPAGATTRGVGELILCALNANVARIILGVGGSATNDGGAGMAQALGARLTDAAGNELPPGGAALQRLAHIDVSGLDPRLKTTEIVVACDVTNPLYGPDGASAVYGPQKGATEAIVETLDTALRHYADVVNTQLGVDLQGLRGGGAAGGLAAGLVAFTGASLRPGVELVIEAYDDLETNVRVADFLISGEGAVDAQTLHGKVITGVAALARRFHKPLFVLTGILRDTPASLYDAGVTAVLPIAPGPVPPAQAIRQAPQHLERTAEALMRTISAISKP